jgi:multiple sugar transport system ATP-binding protein
VRTEIARLHRALKTTMVYVTHDQIEAMTLGHRIVVMKGGEVQQIDTPMNIYRRPINLFVASFLGSPAMNFLPARQHRDGGIHLTHPQRRIGTAAAIDSERELLLGVRAESARIAEGPRQVDEVDIDCLVEVLERIGSESFIYVKYADRELVVRSTSDAAMTAGQGVTIRFNLSALHVFDAGSEQRIDLMLRNDA